MEHVVPGALRRLRATDIISMAGLAAATRGQEHARLGAVQTPRRHLARLSGLVNLSTPVENEATEEESEALPSMPDDHGCYQITVELQGAMRWESTCTCGAPALPLCEHGAALLYEWLAHPGAFVTPDTTRQVPSREEPAEQVTLSPNVRNTTHTTAPSSEPIRAGNPSRANVMLQTQVSVGSLQEILEQLSISELRIVARSHDIVTNTLSKPQIIEALLTSIARPEVIRKSAATLEKQQRQLLAALCLTGSTMTDEELRGLFERFALGQPAHYQRMLSELQARALLFRTSLNSTSISRTIQNGGMVEIGWFVPAEVRSALRVTVPITPYEPPQEDQAESPRMRSMEPGRLLSELLLVARSLDNMSLEGEGDWLEISDVLQAELFGVPGASVSDGAFTIGGTSDAPSEELIERLQQHLPRQKTFLRFALRLLRLAKLLYRDSTGKHIRIQAQVPSYFLDDGCIERARELFALWLKHSSLDELLSLREVGSRLRCRATSLQQPILRPGELEGENEEARRTLLALLAQTSQGQWINFAAFARFVYRLNPLFLQGRQRYFSSPHWWFEQREGRPLKPLHAGDWQHVEYHYLAQCIQGPLYWWGICDIITAPDGKLLAFRLTPQANWLLKGDAPSAEIEQIRQRRLAHVLKVSDSQELLVPVHPSVWPIIETLERFAESQGTRRNSLCYRLTPRALSQALRQGHRVEELVTLLHQIARREPNLAETLKEVSTRIERMHASYGRTRFYTHIPLLEVADNMVLREIEATTTLKEQIVRALNPTTFVLSSEGVAPLIDDLKRRGNTPLVHEGNADETE
ncbi:SWIM zinc finger family protein [Ktedonospora formicarum]|uniref:SWIM-type domain-containing protein n=1 Tax=Ktedonospora formicarum TaxID=2778364 RepID=A0A8J3HVX5_9CHLR|nr:helicase-associated domain-containing protein [Ktedonospora formicarum]GHO44744.1 hypothetical protein KSX_29070 [Ktedonospora formicarum]